MVPLQDGTSGLHNSDKVIFMVPQGAPQGLGPWPQLSAFSADVDVTQYSRPQHSWSD